MQPMHRRKALAILAPEAAKMGITWQSLCGERATKSDMLKDRANIRRLINVVSARSDEGASADEQNQAADMLEAAGTLITELGIKLDEQDAGDCDGASGGTADPVVRDINGERIGTLLNAAALRDERKIAAALGRGRQTAAYDAGDPFASDGARGGLAAFFRGVAGGNTTGSIRAALQDGTDTSGGYAVPSWVLAPIIRALVPASTMLEAGAKMVVLDKPGDSFVIPAVDTIPTPGWRLELGTVLNNNGPTFRAVTIVPRSLAFIFQVSRELLMDAPGMNDALNTVISQAFAKEIDRAGLMGAGVSPEINGILNTTGVQTYSMGTNGAALTFYTDIVKARRALTGVNAPAPNAIITSNREAQTIDLFADSLGQPLRRPQALANLQFLSTTQIPITGTQGTATNAANMFLGDFTKATFYMREQLSVMRLTELYASTGAVGFACFARLDLALEYPAAFCVVEGVTG